MRVKARGAELTHAIKTVPRRSGLTTPFRSLPHFPFDVQFSTDPDVAHLNLATFMGRARNALVDAGLLGINRTKLDDIETIISCFDPESADIAERGYTVPARTRDGAVRLLHAGLFDQTAQDNIRRWGVVTPSTSK